MEYLSNFKMRSAFLDGKGIDTFPCKLLCFQWTSLFWGKIV